MADEIQQINTKKVQIIDTETGEVTDGIRVTKNVNEDSSYWFKVMLCDLLTLFDYLPGKQIKAVKVILNEFRPADGILLASQEELAERAGCSRMTINRVMRLLKDSNLIISPRPSQYMINPAFLMQGSDIKQADLILHYNYIKGTVEKRVGSNGEADC